MKILSIEEEINTNTRLAMKFTLSTKTLSSKLANCLVFVSFPMNNNDINTTLSSIKNYRFCDFPAKFSK